MSRGAFVALAALEMAALGMAALAAWAAPAAAAQLPADAPCRVGPDGRRPDVGPAAPHHGSIGGSLTDRGIGGTGIVGTITGFASVCVDRVEVGFDESAPVLVDGVARSADALRAGQVAVIAAEATPSGLRARSVAVRHEVVGPVDATGPDGLTVAGQRVRSDLPLPGLGSWVAVSGLRDPEGTIHASRIDPAPAGIVTLSGPLVRDGGNSRIGRLRLLGAGAMVEAGTPVTVLGRLHDGLLVLSTLTVEAVLPDRPELRRFLLEAYARREGNTLLLAPGLRAAFGPGFVPPPPERRAVLMLDVGMRGSLVATGTITGAFATGSPGGKPELGFGAGPGELGAAVPSRLAAADLPGLPAAGLPVASLPVAGLGVAGLGVAGPAGRLGAMSRLAAALPGVATGLAAWSSLAGPAAAGGSAAMAVSVAGPAATGGSAAMRAAIEVSPPLCRPAAEASAGRIEPPRHEKTPPIQWTSGARVQGGFTSGRRRGQHPFSRSAGSGKPGNRSRSAPDNRVDALFTWSFIYGAAPR